MLTKQIVRNVGTNENMEAENKPTLRQYAEANSY